MKHKLLIIALLIALCACASLGDKQPVAQVPQDTGSQIVSVPVVEQPDYEAQRILQEKSSGIVLQSSTEALFISEAPKDPEESFSKNREIAYKVGEYLFDVLTDPGFYYGWAWK